MTSDVLHVEYAPGGRSISDFELDEFVDEVKGYISIVEDSMAAGTTRIRISSYTALVKLQLAAVCGDIARNSVVFEFEGQVGSIGDDGGIKWPSGASHEFHSPLKDLYESLFIVRLDQVEKEDNDEGVED